MVNVCSKHEFSTFHMHVVKLKLQKIHVRCNCYHYIFLDLECPVDKLNDVLLTTHLLAIFQLETKAQWPNSQMYVHQLFESGAFQIGKRCVQFVPFGYPWYCSEHIVLKERWANAPSLLSIQYIRLALISLLLHIAKYYKLIGKLLDRCAVSSDFCQRKSTAL